MLQWENCLSFLKRGRCSVMGTMFKGTVVVLAEISWDTLL